MLYYIVSFMQISDSGEPSFSQLRDVSLFPLGTYVQCHTYQPSEMLPYPDKDHVHHQSGKVGW